MSLSPSVTSYKVQELPMVLPLLALQLLRLPGFGLPLYSPAASWYRTGLGLPCLAPTFRSVSACYHLISSLERFRWDFVTFVTFPADSTDCDRARSGNATALHKVGPEPLWDCLAWRPPSDR